MKIDKADIEQFIRTKIELETLTDAQIACLLQVGTSTVAHWRNKFHIKPADKFKRKFGSFQIPVDSFSEPLAVIGWQSQP